MWQLIIGFYLYNLFEYFIHFISHCKYNSYLKYYHLLHHKKSYPITKLLDYAPYKSDRYAFLSFGPYILCYAGVLYYTFKLNDGIIIISENVILLLISVHLHTNYHIKGSYLEKYKWFLIKRELHFNHHKKLNTNYSLGGITYVFDKIFGTYNRINEVNS
jgi:sterol desaturase/sphingolipid hydroxylase (fatty acid hydroxylase superfamily)